MTTTLLKIIPLLLLIANPVFCQDSDTTEPYPSLELKPQIARYHYDAIPKDPLASAFFSATIPGSGQVYNKEYLRGILTATGFYTGFFVAQQMVARWERLNTDTVYLEEYDRIGKPTGNYRQLFVPKKDDATVGLPTEEKVLAAVAGTTMVGCWIFGVLDAYYGAKRYNNKLALASHERKLFMDAAYLPQREESRIKVGYRF